MHLFDKLFQSNEPQRLKAVNTARAIVSLEDTEGWKAFVGVANDLIASFTPDVTTFTPDSASEIAAQMAFVSGIKRCLGLMAQQKDILASLKKPEDA